MWPTKAESTKDAIGSAAKANAAGNAIDKISSANSSNLIPSLQKKKKSQTYKALNDMELRTYS